MWIVVYKKRQQFTCSINIPIVFINKKKKKKEEEMVSYKLCVIYPEG